MTDTETLYCRPMLCLHSQMRHGQLTDVSCMTIFSNYQPILFLDYVHFSLDTDWCCLILQLVLQWRTMADLRLRNVLFGNAASTVQSIISLFHLVQCIQQYLHIHHRHHTHRPCESSQSHNQPEIDYGHWQRTRPPTRWIKEAVHICKEGHWDEGSYQLSHTYDRLLDVTADRRIKTRKNWVPASSDEDLVMRSKRHNKVLKF